MPPAGRDVNNVARLLSHDLGAMFAELNQSAAAGAVVQSVREADTNRRTMSTPGGVEPGGQNAQRFRPARSAFQASVP